MTDQQALDQLRAIEEKVNEGFIPFSGFANLPAIDFDTLLTELWPDKQCHTITDLRGRTTNDFFSYVREEF